jgi:hypothetical protein
MSKIYSGGAPLQADRITTGFDFSCACLARPVKANSTTDFSDLPKGVFFTLRDPGNMFRFAVDPVTIETLNATMIGRLRSQDDRQALWDDGVNLAIIASGKCDASGSRLATAFASGRTEQLNTLSSDRHTRGPRLWQ